MGLRLQLNKKAVRNPLNFSSLIMLLMALILAACAGPPPAPVEDRSAGNAYQSTPDGYYRVKKGDSLYGIAFRFGQDWREIALWNEITAPYVIHPEQLLRVGTVVSPSGSSSSVSGSGVQTSAAPPPGSETRTLETPRTSATREYDPDADAQSSGETVGAGATGVAQTTPGSSSAPGQVVDPSTDSTSDPSAASKGSKQPAGVTYTPPAGDPDRWIWPTEGRVISRFQANDPTRKGVDIGGQAGQKVIASAPGQVVYSGSGLIGYGELIIIKHSDRMLSAYAHNRKRLVSEGEQVVAGSTIAEMGTNDRNQAILHFEIRVNGVPADPLKFLPQR